jgi:hypothetical protein
MMVTRGGMEERVISEGCMKIYNEYARLMDINYDIICKAEQSKFDYAKGRLDDMVKAVEALYRRNFISPRKYEALRRELRAYKRYLEDEDKEGAMKVGMHWNEYIRPSLVEETVRCEVSSRKIKESVKEVKKRKEEKELKNRIQELEDEIAVLRRDKEACEREIEMLMEAKERKKKPSKEEEEALKIVPLEMRRSRDVYERIVPRVRRVVKSWRSRDVYDSDKEIPDYDACYWSISRLAELIEDESSAVDDYEFIAKNAKFDEMIDAVLTIREDEKRHKEILESVLDKVLERCVEYF